MKHLPSHVWIAPAVISLACVASPEPAPSQATQAPMPASAPETSSPTVGIDLTGMPLVHPMFSDHAVVQRDTPIPVWGWAAPGTRIRVSLGGSGAEATAGDNGRWRVELSALAAGGPHDLVVEGPERIERKDVMVGEVWLCSGQSNMEWPVAASNDAQQEIARAKDEQLRVLGVPKSVQFEPKEHLDLAWQPAVAPQIGGFSAVCYFFGRELREKLGVPVGLVNSSWGGTPIRAWMSDEALSAREFMRGELDQFKAAIADLKQNGDRTFDERMQKYWLDNDPGTRAEWQKADSKQWKTMLLPGNWEQSVLPDFDGVVWFQRELEVPAELADKPARLRLGPIDDRDTTWVNGQEVGSGERWDQVRDYPVPAGLLRAGKNRIAIRVLDSGGGGGLHGKPEQLELAIEGAQAMPLQGAWHFRSSVPMSQLPYPPLRKTEEPNQVTVLYNGMISPLAPYRFRGALWYQGETDAWQPQRYRELLPGLIEDWRRTFDAPLSFYIVQLANFMPLQKEPVEQGSWAELREAQSSTAKALPNAGWIVTTDVGAADDIHPRNKQDVGRRLALWALAKDYGQNVVFAGPTFRGFAVEGHRVRIQFEHVGGGLLAKGGGPVRGFAIAGEDGKFVWANARIDGDAVIVSSPKVKAPSAVRYNWASNPVGNLANKEGLPADSFRTDAPR